jgi:hypothetical protein
MPAASKELALIVSEKLRSNLPSFMSNSKARRIGLITSGVNKLTGSGDETLMTVMALALMSSTDPRSAVRNVVLVDTARKESLLSSFRSLADSSTTMMVESMTDT